MLGGNPQSNGLVHHTPTDLSAYFCPTCTDQLLCLNTLITLMLAITPTLSFTLTSTDQIYACSYPNFTLIIHPSINVFTHPPFMFIPTRRKRRQPLPPQIVTHWHTPGWKAYLAKAGETSGYRPPNSELAAILLKKLFSRCLGKIKTRGLSERIFAQKQMHALFFGGPIYLFPNPANR